MKRIVFVGLVLVWVMVFGGADFALADDADNWGQLKIDIRLAGKQLNRSLYITKHDFYYPGALDGIDSYDIEEALFLFDRSSGFSDVENRKLIDDFRSNSSRAAVHIKGYYNGTITPGNEPDITVELSWQYAEPTIGRFGDMSLILAQEYSNGTNDPNGYRGNIRAEMDYSGPDFASIPLGKAPAGTYNENGPYYLHLRLDFDKPLADFNQTHTVDYSDFAIFSKDWRKAGRRMTDISGTDGIPDGYVDTWDLLELVNSWMDSLP